MSMEWKEVKLASLCKKVTVGHVGSMADKYISSGIPFLRSQNIKPYCIDDKNMMYIDRPFHEKLRKSELKEGDVAIVRTGYPGTACVIPKWLGEANCSDLVIIRPSKELNPYFLTAIFNSSFGKNLVSGNLVGAAQQHFNVTVAKELKLKFPPKPIQNKIAAILTAYDDLIENNKRRIELLEKMAEEIYREWFVRFRFPGWEKAKFEKGIPKGWSVEKIKSIVDRKKFGRIYRDNELKSDGKIVVIDQSKSNYLGFYDGKPEHKASIDMPKILFGDHTCKIVLIHRDFSLAENVIPFTPIEGMPVHFLFHLIKNKAIQTEYKRHWTDLTVQEVLVPPNILQEEFSILVKNNYQLIENLKEVIETLNKSKSLLLPRLISGKLSVEELDIQFPPSMLEDATV
ncbi:restriction endonuclease subunit S [Marinomonas foliarum]|uniref:Restriction endonuclease subunit S n=1 Tax=Marinomonas foliarum TaxID=491950 RepID=A0ABX7IT05_9GAMM|nr:restriction endonuclease subunit S [Marinomonas foliarum]QRV24062.1 restriction endonuclease subunit S [Marinomonas foliarum]